jgi:hypothetical protein
VERVQAFVKVLGEPGLGLEEKGTVSVALERRKLVLGFS